MLSRLLSMTIVIAISAHLLRSASSRADAVDAWTPGALTRLDIGGGIVDVSVANEGKLYVASERRVVVYSAESAELVTVFEFPTRVKRVVVSTVRLVVELSDTEIRILDLGSGAWSVVPPQLIPDGETVAALEFLDTTLVIGTSAGTLLLVDIASRGGPVLESVVLCRQVVDGDWWIMSMFAVDGGLYAVLYDRNQASPKGALISISRREDRKWTGERVAVFEGQQAQKVVTFGATAYIQTNTNIFTIDLESGIAATADLRLGDSTYIQAMAVDIDKMYVVTRTDPLPDDNSMTLSSFDMSNPDELTMLSSLRIDYEVGNSATMIARENRVYKAGADEVQVFAVKSGLISSMSKRSVIIPIVTSAVQWDEDEVLIGRQGGICRASLSKNGGLTCFATGRGSDKLIRVQNYVVSVDGANGIWSARIDDSGIVAVDHEDVEKPYHRYVDIAATSSGFAAIMDINQPRAPKIQYRIEHWTVDATGSMTLAGTDDVETPDCSSGQVRAASDDGWLGLLCGAELIEFALRNDAITRLGSATLASRGADLDVNADGVVVIGTSVGVFQYDRVDHKMTALKLPPGVAAAGVLAVKISREGIFAVHGASSGARGLFRYYLQGNRETSELLRYDRLEGRPQQTRIVEMGEGIVLVTGSRVAVYLRPIATNNRRLSLPFVLQRRIFD